jgi:urease accessory protein
MPKATVVTRTTTATTGMITIMITPTTLMAEPAVALPLLIWLSPAFPVGAFAYSQGLEWAVEDGTVTNAATLEAWLGDILAHGAIRADAVLLAAAHRAATVAEALEVNDLALALAPSQERHLETSAQGTAFLTAVRASWPAAALDALADALGDAPVAYPVALGVAAAAHGLPLPATLQAFVLAAISNMVSAALRLGPIGQTDAQIITAHLCPAIAALAREATTATLDDLGTAAWGADIASMRHETQYSRLFRS